MIVTKKALPRRTVLRGAAATLALPFLDAMGPAAAEVRTTAAKPVYRSARTTCRAGWRWRIGHPSATERSARSA